jgi:hypothetical protein
LFFDRTDSFINRRKHLVSFFNLLGLKPVPQFSTLSGCQLFDCFLDFNQIAHIKAVNSKFRLSQPWFDFHSPDIAGDLIAIRFPT